MLHQTFQPHDLLIVLLLVVLEGILSIDNALVLGLLAKRLPRRLQRRALTYGLFGAFIFRLVAIAIAARLLEWRVIKLLGGGYLIYVALKHLFFAGPPEHEKIILGPDGLPIAVDEQTGRPLNQEELAEEMLRRTHGASVDIELILSTHSRKFWSAVLAIELTDLAFAVDSILAAIALVGAAPLDTPPGAMHPKLWVIVTGGFLGVVLMRFAAVVFIHLLDRFPRFEISAYLLVFVIGGKLIADWRFNADQILLDFHSPGSIAFWVFWLLMLLCFSVGFLPRHQGETA